MKTRDFIEQVANQVDNDYSQAFKLLGLVVFVAQEGNEPLLSGEMISPRTYYRWVEKIKQAGYGDLLAEARLRQVISDFINQRLGELSSSEVSAQINQVVQTSLELEKTPNPRS